MNPGVPMHPQQMAPLMGPPMGMGMSPAQFAMMQQQQQQQQQQHQQYLAQAMAAQQGPPSQRMPNHACGHFNTAAGSSAPPMGVCAPGASMMMAPPTMPGMPPMGHMPPQVPMVPENSTLMVVNVPAEARPNEEILIVAPDGHKFVVVVRARIPPLSTHLHFTSVVTTRPLGCISSSATGRRLKLSVVLRAPAGASRRRPRLTVSDPDPPTGDASRYGATRPIPCDIVGCPLFRFTPSLTPPPRDVYPDLRHSAPDQPLPPAVSQHRWG